MTESLSARIAAISADLRWDIGPAEQVPMVRWGKDHWTTFLYVEACCVDYRGMLDHDRMRCDRRRHHAFYCAKRRTTAFGSDADGARYPTRLKSERPLSNGTWDTVDLTGHDDYLADAIREGLVEACMPAPREPGRDVFLNSRGEVITDVDGGLVSPTFVTGLTEAWLMTCASYALTEHGRAIVSELRAYRSTPEGRMSHQFMPRELSDAR